MKEKAYLTAAEAAKELGISLPTLYSYVSRRLIRSEAADRSRRTRRYSAEDVQRLKERQEQRRDPTRVVDTALNWGTPILDSAITLIDSGKLYYRGQDALALAENETVERVAAWIWTGDREAASHLFRKRDDTLSPRCRLLLDCLPDSTPMERFQTLLPVAATEDVAGYDLRPSAVVQTGARLLRLLTTLACDRSLREGGVTLRTDHSPDAPDSIATALQRAWRPKDPGAAPLLSAALILCADHELNVSSFTARCVASAGSPPYAVVSAGLAALQGGKHGGATARVEALFREARSAESARAVILDRIKRGDSIPGFRHPLYPQGDPRGRLLMDLTTRSYPNAPAVALANTLANEAASALDDFPNLDFGLATLCSALELPAGSALTLFALGRTIGWIGHALEEYQSPRLIRPRAHYIGALPQPESARSA